MSFSHVGIKKSMNMKKTQTNGREANREKSVSELEEVV